MAWISIEFYESTELVKLKEKIYCAYGRVLVAGTSVSVATSGFSECVHPG